MNNMKCVVVGDSAVGKTCLLLTHLTSKFPSDHIPAVYYGHTLNYTIGNDPYTLGVFDTSTRQDDDDRLRPLGYPQTDIFLVCFSVASPTSYENIRENWFPEIHHWCPGIPRLVVGTQTDLRSDPSVIEKLARQKQRPITAKQGRGLANDIGAVKYVECSALTQEGLKNVFDEIVAAVHKTPTPKGYCCGCLIL